MNDKNQAGHKPARVFAPFEIFWHWSQSLLIFGLLLTGLEMNGIYTLFRFETAFVIHITLAWLLIGLWLMAIFWHITTGEWRNYMPTGKGLMSMAAYYAYGIFSGESKPYAKTAASKHNPLQRLAYFVFKVAIAPALWVSGLLLLSYNLWRESLLGAILPLAVPAAIHVAAALAIMVFLIVHIYLASTTGNPWYAYLRAMITGYSNERSADEASP